MKKSITWKDNTIMQTCTHTIDSSLVKAELLKENLAQQCHVNFVHRHLNRLDDSLINSLQCNYE